MAVKKVSLSDIAKSLGVSKTLVSMVLNNHADEKGISKATQKRVWEKIKEFNYKPNMMARGLRLGRSNTIGLIVSDISNPFYAKIARHIENVIEPKGFNIMICSTDEDVEKEVRLIKMLRDRQTDGLIISTSQRSSKEIKILLDEKYPFVLIDRVLPDIKTNSVIVDNFKGSYHAVNHMLQQGYKNIAAFAVTPTYVSTINDRVEGYLRAIKDFGLTYGRAYLKEIPYSSVKSAVKKELTVLLNSKEKVDAIFAVNNNIAIACLECLNDMKARIPEDLAFVCFDDLEVFKFGRPSITAISQPIEEIAKSAVEILLENIKNKENRQEFSQVKLPTTLIVRRSTVN